MITLYTVGHSNLTFEAFAALLKRHGVALVVDVRSDPYSRFAPHFSKGELECALRDAGLRYLYEGAALGGKPKDETLYNRFGSPDYDKIAETEAFRAGLERLQALASQQVTAILCSEEDPYRCHREKLVARKLREAGVEVRHIRGKADAPAQGSLGL